MSKSKRVLVSIDHLADPHKGGIVFIVARALAERFDIGAAELVGYWRIGVDAWGDEWARPERAVVGR